MHKLLKTLWSLDHSHAPISMQSQGQATTGTLLDRLVALRSNLITCHDLKPATLAVVLQAVALLLVFAANWVWLLTCLHVLHIAFTPNIVVLVVAQSTMAMLLSVVMGMDRWWRWIHACFPLAILAMSQWHVPNEIYLVAFLFSLSLYWTTFRTQVPFFPSRPVAWQHVADLLPAGKPVHLIDIGSGIGDMVMHVASHSGTGVGAKNSSFTGIEIAALPWLVSYIRGRLRRSQAVFKLGDYNELNFSRFDVVFAYLSPAAMLKLWAKASREMRAGSMLISYEFEIPGITPSRVIPGSGQSPSLYVWQIGAIAMH